MTPRCHTSTFFRALLLLVCAFGTALGNELFSQDVAESKTPDASVPVKAATKVEKTDRSSVEIFNEYQQKLENLAKKCEERGMTLEAKVTRSKIYSEKEYFFTVPLLSRKKQLEKLPHDASKEQQSWFAALKRLQERYADETFAVAERQGSKKKGFDVVACVLQTLYVNPDHERARRFLGYSLYNDEWRSQWEIKKLDKGYVDDPTFGWILEDHVERYRAGERYYRNQWISREEEEKKTVASSSGWEVETEHFSILSRVSLERGVEIGRFLESYYQAWSRLFYPFIANENQWTSRLYTGNAIVSKRHKVILYRNRAEYVRELRKHDRNAAVSVGGYFPDLRCIFVYEPDPNDVDDAFELFPMLAHEATHQLFSECNIPNSANAKFDNSKLAIRANFWACEGIAITAETFDVDSTKNLAEMGGCRNVFRIEDALDSLFVDKSYIPLREFAGMSRKAFQAYDDLNLLYSQAAGTAFFLMFYDKGKYCDAFVRYLYAIYQGTDAPDSLERLTGKQFEELDQEYVAFMREIYEKTRGVKPPENVKSAEK
ncbi:MAG: hypothetical protein IJM54_01390 [Thermoguttaceae bacterium]|nr:hypothetical protein [Thermoguttaceae bacterium]